MLEPNSIPSEEPILSVGIILPEDKFRTIRMQLPVLPEYCFFTEGEQHIPLKANSHVEFHSIDGEIEANIDGKIFGSEIIWKIDPLIKPVKIEHKAGICVNGVIAGRVFHWKKNIDVFLPGSLEIRLSGDSLILINELPMEQYLMCVATSEMGAACQPSRFVGSRRACPLALIESQTIISRSWMLANVETKHRLLGMDVCNDDCCQRYQGTTYLSEHSIKGAFATVGMVLLFDNKICDTRYHKSCGGVSEAFENIWSGGPVPYIRSIVDADKGFLYPALPLDSEEKVRQWIESTPATFCSPLVIPEKELFKYLGNVDEEGEYFRWKFTYSQKQMSALLNLKLNLNARCIKRIEPVKRGNSGRLVELKVIYESARGNLSEIIVKDQYVIRESFHELFLYSSAFIVDTEGDPEEPDVFILKGAGWGHGAGYCQIGALGMSLKGYSTEEILSHYYPGAVLAKIY